MKMRRMAMVMLVALVLAALLPLSAAAEAGPMVYIHGQVRVGDATSSDGVIGATVELYFEGALVRSATTKSDAGDFGFGVSGEDVWYMLDVNDLALPAPYVASAPVNYFFLLPPASPTVGPFYFAVS